MGILYSEWKRLRPEVDILPTFSAQVTIYSSYTSISLCTLKRGWLINHKDEFAFTLENKFLHNIIFWVTTKFQINLLIPSIVL